jgi:TRAP-type uncharacterized transport system fused permease subunit
VSALLVSSLLLLNVIDVDLLIGLQTTDDQWYMMIVMACLALVYPLLRVPLLIAGAILAWEFDWFVRINELGNISTLVIAVPLVALLVHSVWKTSGRAFAIVLLSFFTYALLGHLLPPPLTGLQLDFQQLIPFLFFDNTSMLGICIIVMVDTVFLFILAGKVITHFGLSKALIDFVISRVNSPSRVAIISSAIFGSISGSAVANVMSTGQLTIPMMITNGYSRAKAAAYEAVASTGGQLTPPIMGATAFLMAELLEVDYWDIALWAIFPALVFYAVLLFFAPAGNHDVSFKADYWSELKIPNVKNMLTELANDLAPLLLLGASIGFIIGILEQTGLAFSLSALLLQASGGHLYILLPMIAVLCIVLGMGMPTLSAYFIVAVLLAPSLIDAGIGPIAAHMFVLYFSILSMVTPPVAISSFAAARIAKADPMETALLSAKLALPLIIMPFLFVWF